MQDLSLAQINEAFRALAAATTVQEVKSHIDAGKMAEVFARQAKLGQDLELRAFQYVKQAERKLGEMLQAAKAAGQIKVGGSGGNRYQKSRNVPDENNSTFTLEEAGISRKLSSHAQKLASVPKEEFEKAIAEGKEPVTKAVQSDGEKPPRPKKTDQAPRPHYRAEEVMRMHDAGISNALISDRTGIGKRSVDNIIDEERLRREGVPVISRDQLSFTAQEKLDLAIKQEKKKLQQSFDAAVTAEVNQRVRDYMEAVSERLAKEREEHKRVMNARDGFMTKSIYRMILMCLHEDRQSDPQKKELCKNATIEFKKLEKCILNEKESPTTMSAPLPRTIAEWEEIKRKVAAERRARRAAAKSNKDLRKYGTNGA